jgi:hypothetical protein
MTRYLSTCQDNDNKKIYARLSGTLNFSHTNVKKSPYVYIQKLIVQAKGKHRFETFLLGKGISWHIVPIASVLPLDVLVAHMLMVLT